MCLFNLVKQQYRVRFSPDSLSEMPSLFISHIARRCADKLCHRVFFHELRHVCADHCLLIIKQELCERLCEFGFSNTGWSHEYERAKWSVRVLDTGARPAHCICHSRNGLILSDDTASQVFFYTQEFLDLALKHLCHRYACPLRHDLGNIFLVYFFFQEFYSVLRFRQAFVLILKLFLQTRQPAVSQFRRLFKVAAPLSLF